MDKGRLPRVHMGQVIRQREAVINVAYLTCGEITTLAHSTSSIGLQSTWRSITARVTAVLHTTRHPSIHTVTLSFLHTTRHPSIHTVTLSFLHTTRHPSIHTVTLSFCLVSAAGISSRYYLCFNSRVLGYPVLTDFLPSLVLVPGLSILPSMGW